MKGVKWKGNAPAKGGSTYYWNGGTMIETGFRRDQHERVVQDGAGRLACLSRDTAG
jgi:hypothetical protein